MTIGIFVYTFVPCTLRKDNMKLTESQKLKQRIIKVRPFMPPRYTPVILEAYPEYNTIEGRQKITNVVSAKSSDLKLTQICEALFMPAKKSNQKEAVK